MFGKYLFIGSLLSKTDKIVGTWKKYWKIFPFPAESLTPLVHSVVVEVEMRQETGYKNWRETGFLKCHIKQ